MILHFGTFPWEKVYILELSFPWEKVYILELSFPWENDFTFWNFLFPGRMILHFGTFFSLGE